LTDSPIGPSAGPVRLWKRLFARKSVALVQSQFHGEELHRHLGPINLTSLGVGCIIGAGIFVITGQAAAAHAGPAIILSFVIAGFVCAFAGLCYAELASVLPVSGSAYTYAYTVLGEIVAWVMGLLLVLEYGLAASTVAVGWSGYVVSFLSDFGIFIPATLAAPTGTAVTLADGTAGTALLNLPALLGVAFVTGLLVLGVSESARANNFFVVLKVSVLIAFIVIGAFYVDRANWTPFIPPHEGGNAFGIQGVFRAAAIIFFAYVGFEAVSTAAAEAKNPQRDLPIGIIGSLTISTLLYMLTALVLVGIVPFTLLAVPDPMARAVDEIGLGWFSFAIKAGAILGLSSVMLVLLYGQTRIFYTMGRDGLLPPVFSKLHSKRKTPWANTVIVGGAVAAAAATTPISVLGDLVSLGTLAAFAIVCISVMYLRSTHPELPRPFKVPLYPVVPILGVLTCGFLIFQMPLHNFMLIGGYLAVGLVVYFLYGIRHSRIARPA
jgi:APA family basic amino acid/polyamine antiporter